MENQTQIIWHGIKYRLQGEFWISEDESRIMFNGYIYRWDGFYFRRGGTTGINPYSALHRAVWAFHKGEIPKGYHVHHKDHDGKNNDISNLELHSPSEHSKYHGRNNPWIGSEGNIKQLRENNEKAKLWHKSEEGRKWHSEHGKETWEKRKTATKSCVICEKSYETSFPDRSKFCSGTCKQRHYRKYYFRKEKRVCQVCKSPFEIYEYSSTRTCSKPCACSMSNHTKRVRSDSSI